MTPAAGSRAVLLDGQDVYAAGVSPIQLRRRVGMVFQKPTPFPTMSIYDNVAAGLLLGGRRSRAEVAETVERALRQAALWDEVKDRLRASALALSGRSAAAALPRAHHRPGTRGDPARRADGLARPAGHPADRGAGLRAQARLHHRDRDPQHAAGRPGLRHDGVLLPGRHGRARRHPADLHDAPEEQTEAYITGRFG